MRLCRWLLYGLIAPVCCTLASSAWAQQPGKIPAVAILVTHAQANDPVFDALRSGLRDLGYQDGRNVLVKAVTAEGQLEQLPGLAAQLVRDEVDVIVAPNLLSVQAALAATSTIPIVMVGYGGDPVSAGFADSFGRPGRNLTGVYALDHELEAKRLEILKEAIPGLSRVAYLWDASFRPQLSELQRTALALSIRLEPIEVRGAQGLEGAFNRAKRGKAGAVMLSTSPLFYVHRTRVAELSLAAGLPTATSWPVAVKAGVFMAYAADLESSWRRTAYYVDRLLKGAKPRDLPVERVSKLRLVLNAKSAKALGVMIPQSVLLRADEIVE